MGVGGLTKRMAMVVRTNVYIKILNFSFSNCVSPALQATSICTACGVKKVNSCVYLQILSLIAPWYGSSSCWPSCAYPVLPWL